MPQTYPTRERVTPEFVASWNIADMSDPWLVISSIPTDDPALRLAVLSLIQCEATHAEDMHGRRVQVYDYVVHPVVVRDQKSGKSSVARRLVIPQMDALPVDIISEHAVRSLGMLAELSGRTPPWDPPLEVLVKNRRTKGGKSRLEFVLIK